MRDRNFPRASFNDKRSLYTCFRHYNVIAALAHDLKAFNLESLDQLFIMNLRG